MLNVNRDCIWVSLVGCLGICVYAYSVNTPFIPALTSTVVILGNPSDVGMVLQKGLRLLEGNKTLP